MAATKRPTKTAKKTEQPAAPKTDSRIDRLEKLVGILEGSTLSSLEYEDSDMMVKLSRAGAATNGHAGPAIAAPVVVAAPPPVAPLAVAAAAPKKDEANV